MRWDEVGGDGMSRDGMKIGMDGTGWDGMGYRLGLDGTERDGIGWDWLVMVWNGMG